MEAIKNIIFDLGGVLLNIDYNKTADGFSKLGVEHFDDLFSQYTANDLFENFETGKISEDEFYDQMISYCAPGTTREQVCYAWDAMLLTYRSETLDIITTLRKNYKVFLLSNTNSIHITAFKKIFTRDTGMPSLDEYFDRAYYSHLIHYRKPYLDTYHYVLQDGNMEAHETLFIDDSIQNIEGAKIAGMQTHLLLPSKTIGDIDLLK